MSKHDCIPAELRLNRRTGEFSLSVSVDHDSIIKSAQSILKKRFLKPGPLLNSEDKVKLFLQLELAEYEREVFACIFLDNRHRFIAFEKLFYGTINQATIHHREVVKAALAYNAAAVIVAHNHPSGSHKPSAEDVLITMQLSKSLEMVDIRLLDHFIVTSKQVSSLKEDESF